MIVLIPAYEPDAKLGRLLHALREAAPEVSVVVVDDGSGPRYASVFAEASLLGADVLGYAVNRGKGAALKHGFAHVERHYPGEPVVCADSDGQHRVEDILAVARRVRPAAMVLGVRSFTGRVPARSRFGNAVTRWAFKAATGFGVSDTQTGLRGYPSGLLAWLQTIPGDRFEYELNLLLRARPAGVEITEVPIATVYLGGNASSHFRPLADSVRVYAPLLKYSASSLGAFGLDFLALLAVEALTGNLLAAVIAARGLSSAVNFLTNRRLVFSAGRSRPLGGALARYYVVVVAVLAANFGLLQTLTGLGVGLVPAKLVTEVTLFLAGYQLQRTFVFGAGRARPVVAQPSRMASSARA